jgi:hypothetical protein
MSRWFVVSRWGGTERQPLRPLALQFAPRFVQRFAPNSVQHFAEHLEEQSGSPEQA